MLHTPDPTDLKPCWHMRTLVSAWTDGKLKGFAKWYTERHLRDCPQCQSSLPFLRALQERLFTLAGHEEPKTTEGLTEERWQVVEQAWEAAERKSN